MLIFATCFLLYVKSIGESISHAFYCKYGTEVFLIHFS